MYSSQTAAGYRLLGALAAGVLLLSGCGHPRTENAAKTVMPPPPEPVPFPPSTAPPLPPRPSELPLDDLDPCALLTADQRAQLGFDRDPLPGVEAGFGDAATCSYRNSTAKVGARLSLVTVEGIEVWTSETAQVRTKPVMISEFPALVIRTPELNLACNVAVDVAEGQHLDVLYRDDGAQPPPPLDQLCAGAKHVAEAAITSLARTRSPESAPTTSSG